MIEGTRASRRRGSVARLASATYATTALGLITAPIVARSIGPEGRGAYAAVMSYSALASTILGLGIALTVNRAVLSEGRDPSLVLGACARFCAFVALPAILIGGLVYRFVLDDYGDVARLAALVFVALAPLGIFQLCLNSLMLASGSLGSYALVRSAPLLINAAGVVFLAAIGQLSLLTYLTVTLVGLLTTLALSIRGAATRPRPGLSIRPLLRFGLRAYPASLAYLGNAQLDQMLVAPFLGAADLGRYAIAVTLASVPLGLIQALGARYQSQMNAPDGSVSFDAVAARMRSAILVGALGAILMAPIVPIAVPILFGSEFAFTTPLCLILLIGSVPQAIGTAAGPALILSNRPGTVSLAQGVGLAVTAVGLAITLPTIGVIGAAITTVVAYMARAVVEIVALRRLGVRGFVPTARDVADLRRRGGDVLRRSPVSRLSRRTGAK